ncbi:hypothetical protein LTR84_012806 [Exophiala bonariae]|uniref:Protein ZIP4 homolog n=1 Tax=Exophiala bonariae TaxID=1690606 RepID=A0AAV9MUS6_9EURO|nr:hypothetical protein LTR84_012806 [Exophiala bonariae]
MPSTKSTRKAQSVLDFAKHLQDYLDKHHSSSTQPFPDISIYIEVLPLSQQDISPPQCVEFDRVGVAIWNRCRTLRESGQDLFNLTDLAKVRAFAYLVLDTAAGSYRKDAVNQRTFNSGLKAVKDCLLVDTGGALTVIGTKIVEQLASRLEGVSPELRTQYLLLRILLAWKQDRLELAEHFGHQLEGVQSTLTASDRQQFGDLCYEIGNDQMKRDHMILARKWLRRGLYVCTDQGLEPGDVDISELRLNLMHSHGEWSFVEHGSREQQSYTQDEGVIALQSLRSNFDKFPVKVLQLEVYAQNSKLGQDAYYSVLLDVIGCAHLIPTNHRLILHHIHLLKLTSPSFASQALRTYIVQRLVLHDDVAWVEAGLLTLLWMLVTSAADSTSVQNELELALNDTYEVWSNALSPEATHGAFILLWKRIGDSFKTEHHRDTVQWCCIALHKLFSNAGDENIGKIERMMIKCYLELSQFNAALGVFEDMPATRKSHPLSRVLCYSLALRRHDSSLIQSALNALALAHSDQNRTLFAAVSETMKYGTKRQGAQLLQRILDKYHNTPSPEIDKPLLLRCTARLLILALTEEDYDLEELLSRLCAILKTVAALTYNESSRELSSTALSLSDCKWFKVTVFRTAVQNIDTWPDKSIALFLPGTIRTVTILLNANTYQIRYPDEISLEDKVDRKIYEIDASCVQAMLYLRAARACCSSTTISDMPKSSYSSETPPITEELRSTLYRNLVDKYSCSQSLLDGLVEGMVDRDLLKHTKAKLVNLLPFAFESTLFLITQTSNSNLPESLLSLSQLVDHAVELKAPDVAYPLIVDMILASVTADADYALILDQHDISKRTTTNSSKLDSDQAQALQIVKTITEQALSLAIGSDHPSSLRYPAEEVEWLASTLFNLSVDILYWSQARINNIDQRKQQPHDNEPRPEELASSTCNETDPAPQRLPSVMSGHTAESGAAPGAKAPRDAGTAALSTKSNLNLSCDHDASCLDTDTKVQSKDNKEPKRCDITSPQQWASLAVQLADLLDDTNRGSPGRHDDLPDFPGWVAGNTYRASADVELADSRSRQGGAGGGAGSAYGDGGALARVIRERCRMLGWENPAS